MACLVDFDDIEDAEQEISGTGSLQTLADLNNIAAQFGSSGTAKECTASALTQAADADDEHASDDDGNDTSQMTVEFLAKKLAKERQHRKRLEKKLDIIMQGVQELASRQDKIPDIWALGERRPAIHPTAWVAPGASLIGTVILHPNSSVWFNCTLRGDNELITIGEDTDVQDNSVLHCDPGKPLTIGKNCLVGHQVCLHGCTIGENCLIGMRTTILDNAKIGSNCFVAAGSFVGEGKVFGDNLLIGGNPAKKIQEITESDPMCLTLKMAASTYVENKERFQKHLKPFFP